MKARIKRQDGRHGPEAFPDPFGAKHGTDRGKTTQAVTGFDVAFKHLAKGLDLIRQERPQPLTTPAGKSGGQRVVLALGVKEIGRIRSSNANLGVLRGRQLKYLSLHHPRTNRQRYFLFLQRFDRLG